VRRRGFIDGFDLSEKLYSLYFAFNAIGLIGGPALYLRLSRVFARPVIIMGGFVCTCAAGMLMYLFGSLQPWLFAVCLFPATIMGSCIRTPGTNLILEQQEGDTGSAVALMSCFAVFMGSLGMTVISQDWGRYHLGSGSHENPGWGCMPGIVGALVREALCQADS
jgi:MFS transporter, DHA1 family, multidrug resistance protein